MTADILTAMSALRTALTYMMQEANAQLTAGSLDPDLESAEESARDALKSLAHVGAP